MARSFTSTDVVNPAAVNLNAVTKGACFWAIQDSAVNNARWIDITGASQFQIYFGTVNNRFTFTHFTDATAGLWYVNEADHGLTLSNWFFFGIAWNGEIGELPVCYVASEGQSNTTQVTVTEQTFPTGNVRTDASVNVWIGNNSTGTAPCNGDMAYVTVFNRVPSQTDFDNALLASTSGLPAGALAGHWALDASSPADDLSGNGNDGVITGTSVVTDPTLFTPATRSVKTLLGFG